MANTKSFDRLGDEQLITQCRALLARNASKLSGAGVLQVSIVGSLATREMAGGSDFSDVDFLIVCVDAVGNGQCAAIAERLRSMLRDAIGTEIHIGARCRKLAELPEFLRHLTFFGFHSANAVSLMADGTDFGNLDERRPNAHEYLCALIECLCGEVRARGRLSSAEAAMYADSKYALFYLNLILVANGVCLPTHAARLAAWAMLGDAHRMHLAPILRVKLGAGSSSDIQACAEIARELRRLAFCALIHLEQSGEDGLKALYFWCDSAMHSVEQDLCIGHAVAAALYDRIDNRSPSIRNLRFADDPWYREFRQCLDNEDSRVPSAIQLLRCRFSQAARRDWGHVALE